MMVSGDKYSTLNKSIFFDFIYLHFANNML